MWSSFRENGPSFVETLIWDYAENLCDFQEFPGDPEIHLHGVGCVSYRKGEAHGRLKNHLQSS
jgi:hypothetical protein